MAAPARVRAHIEEATRTHPLVIHAEQFLAQIDNQMVMT